MSHVPSFAEKFPTRVHEWSEDNEKTAWEVGSWSHLKVKWNCSKGHSYYSKVNAITAGQGCGVCAGKAVLAGFNDLEFLRPDIAIQWHPTKNDLKPSEVTQGSGKKVWWVCELGHEWPAIISERTSRGFGCGVCSGQYVQQGVNDLATVNPVLAEHWSLTRNDKKPTEVTASSKYRAWWTGDCGHEWQSDVGSRNRRKDGCPFCTGRKVLSGFNDLATLSPAALDKWDYARNEVEPDKVSPGSHKKVYWTDKCGHSWYAGIRNVAQKGFGCAVCAGKHGGFDENTLAKAEPFIASQWHPENDRTAEEVTRVSAYRAQWICEKGHEFVVRVCDRVNYQTGCPRCSSSQTSKPEQEMAEFIASLGVDIVQQDRSVAKGYVLDVTVPELKIAFEFNGVYWHTEEKVGKSYHYDKTDAVIDSGWSLVQVWEDDWRDRKDIVKRMIAMKVGKSQEVRLNARSLRTTTVPAKEAAEFLEDNHIQGFSGGSTYAALVDQGNSIKALLVLKKVAGNEYSLVRYATEGIVRGGFTRLFKFAVAESGASRVVTFSDRCVSDGGLYARSGFVAEETLREDYTYKVRSTREHKFNYRLKRFREDPNLKYKEGLTERELAKQNNLSRIYDAGKVRWAWTC